MIIKEELMPVLFGVYLQFYLKIQQKFGIKRANKFLVTYKTDFISYNKFLK